MARRAKSVFRASAMPCSRVFIGSRSRPARSAHDPTSAYDPARTGTTHRLDGQSCAAARSTRQILAAPVTNPAPTHPDRSAARSRPRAALARAKTPALEWLRRPLGTVERVLACHRITGALQASVMRADTPWPHRALVGGPSSA
jgi:hypothetical protein